MRGEGPSMVLHGPVDMPFDALTGVRLTRRATNTDFSLAKAVVIAVAMALVKLAGFTKNLVSKGGVEVLQQWEVLFHNEETLLLHVTAIDGLVVDANQLSGSGAIKFRLFAGEVSESNLVTSR